MIESTIFWEDKGLEEIPMDKRRRRKRRTNTGVKNRVRNRKRRDKRRRRHISGVTIAAFCIMCLLTIFMVTRSSAIGKKIDTVVTLKVEDVEIKQGEEKPVFKAVATCEGNVDTVLEEKSGYTVANLVDELNRGIGYTLECAEDGTLEGKHPIKAELTSEISTPLYHEWFGKIELKVEDGTFHVLNKYGEWDGDKFKLWEGEYAASKFITYRDKTYYMDVAGEKVTGWQEIEGNTYYFSKKGVMKTGWKETDDTRYYFDETGKMSVGWVIIKDDKYFFDEKGKVVTGEMKKGIATYTFDEKGKLVSAEGVADPDKPMVALTFDDGPGVRTMELLEMLEKNGARATFFMLGKNAAIFKDTVRKMVEIGCELGNHTYDHPNLATISVEDIKHQISVTDQAVLDAAGQSVTVMRPPYGSINDKVRENVGHPMIFWSIDTLDWKTRNASQTVSNVMNSVQDGDIILLHDIHSETIDAAEQLIPKLQAAGYQLVTVSEMAEARGITLENGVKYGRLSKQQ